jgi:hypothetical protein
MTSLFLRALEICPRKDWDTLDAYQKTCMFPCRFIFKRFFESLPLRLKQKQAYGRNLFRPLLRVYPILKSRCFYPRCGDHIVTATYEGIYIYPNQIITWKRGQSRPQMVDFQPEQFEIVRYASTPDEVIWFHIDKKMRKVVLKRVRFLLFAPRSLLKYVTRHNYIYYTHL